MPAELRQARYGHLSGPHILPLRARGFTPAEIAEVPSGSRPSAYRTVAAYRRGKSAPPWTQDAPAAGPAPAPQLRGWQRSLIAILRRTPHASGWRRTRRGRATLSLQLPAQRGYAVSREALRRTLHDLGHTWERARHAAPDDDPERAPESARVRHPCETSPRNAALFFAGELDIHRLAKLGYAWMLKGGKRQSRRRARRRGATWPGRATT